MANTPHFQGSAALELTRKATAFGERPSGSIEIEKLRTWIVAQLKPLGGQLELDRFVGQTPIGPVKMENIILKFRGSSGKVIALTGHYDTKRIAMVHFVGANDGGSSTGFLIEAARIVSKTPHRDDIHFVFFDGEEAVRPEWSDNDSRYGSRHLVDKWSGDGTFSRLKALINIDMVGDANLDLSNDSNSSESLRSMVAEVAKELGYSRYFRSDLSGIDDDHKPFADAGANVIDIIDLDYGPWHTERDTMDKLSAHSLQVVGDVVLEAVRRIERS